MHKFFQTLKDIWSLTIPFFISRNKITVKFWLLGERQIYQGLFSSSILVLIIALEIAYSLLIKKFNYWNNDFYNSIQKKNFDEFKSQLLIFSILAFSIIIVAVYKSYVNQFLGIIWRRMLTKAFVEEWTTSARHYTLRYVPEPVDNPDQRISEDADAFVNLTLALGVNLFGTAFRLILFIGILWDLSEKFPMQTFGASFNIPGYLIWVSVLYSLFGATITSLIGRFLKVIEFTLQKVEANFRFSLVLLRENSEQIALLNGDFVEKAHLGSQFDQVVATSLKRIRLLKSLNWFESFFNQLSIIFPFIILSPAYFFGKVELGDLMQTASAFGSVQDYLNWFMAQYAELAKYQSVVDRLAGFQRALEQTRQLQQTKQIQITPSDSGMQFALKDLTINKPDGSRLIRADKLVLNPGERLLLSGPSGSGKTTFLRAIAGIWPFGNGEITYKHSDKLMMLPQRSYIPEGTLREVVSYPNRSENYTQEQMLASLTAVGLANFIERLDEKARWSLILSGGEQQRIGLARALLVHPDYLFLDEATSNLDEAAETVLYQTLFHQLPNAGILSIGHRSTLNALHERIITIAKTPLGNFVIREALAS